MAGTGTDRIGTSMAEPRSHDDHDHLAAVFADRAHAAAAVDDLRSLGLGSEHLGIAVHEGGDDIVFEHDAETELVHDMEVGAAVGSPIGAIAGISVAALAVPGVGVIGVGGMLALAGASAMWGALIGAALGASEGETGWDEHERLGELALDAGQVMVVVCSHGRDDTVRAVMQRHAGRLRVVEARRR